MREDDVKNDVGSISNDFEKWEFDSIGHLQATFKNSVSSFLLKSSFQRPFTLEIDTNRTTQTTVEGANSEGVQRRRSNACEFFGKESA